MDVVCTCNAYVQEFKLFKEKISSKKKALLLRNIFQDQSTSPFTYIGTNTLSFFYKQQFISNIYEI